MPSLPSSAAPTATFVPFSTLRGSVVTSSPVGRNATTQSMRGHRGRRHAPPTFRYVGRLVVEKKPSGRTPSAGAGSKRASGACDSGGASKLGGRYWNRGRLTEWQNYVQRTDLRNVSHRGLPIADLRNRSSPFQSAIRNHSSDTGSRSTVTPSTRRPSARHARITRPSARGSADFTSRCQRQRPCSRVIGHGAGPSTVRAPLKRSSFARRSQPATRSAAACASGSAGAVAGDRAAPPGGGAAGGGGG